MQKKIALIATTIALIAIPILPSTAFAASTDTSHPCQRDGQTHQRFLWQDLEASNERTDSVSADILVRGVWPCSIGDSISAVLPVNVENTTVGNFIAQLGYGRSDGPPTNGALKWLYTPNTCSAGVAAVVPGWPNPIDGHTYRLTVTYITSSSRWRGYMDDYIDGLGNPIGVWYNDGECAVWSDLIWSGFETHDLGDMMGGSLWTPITNLTYQIQGTSLNIYWTDGSNGFIGTSANWWNTEVYNSPSPRDAIRAYTN